MTFLFSGRKEWNEKKKEVILRGILCVFALIPAIILIILFSYIFSLFLHIFKRHKCDKY